MGDSSARPRIVVVGHEARERELLRAWLGPAHDVVEAADGPAAIAEVERGGVDLVLLAVELPGMSGFEACRAIRRNHPDDTELPVLLFGAQGQQASRIQGLAAGADDFISIPCDPTELTLRVAVFLRTRRQAGQIREQLARLTRLSALRDDLVALVAHDLRGPLGSVLTLVGLARDDVEDPEIRKDLSVAYSAAERAREIADDLLQVRLLEHGEHTLRRVAAPAGEVVRDAVRTVGPAARSRNVDVHVDVQGDPVFPLDGALVRRAVENLLANAVRHSPEGAAVTVAVHRAGADLAIDVVDRGPAIPPEARDAVFRTFAPVERHALPRRAYGLGLFLVRLVAEAHGGGATIEGVADGGTLFRLRLAPPAGPRPAGAEGQA